jgi:hypothetical protein
MKLEELKKNYSILEKKYKLPSFKELNEDFGIEILRKGEELLLRSVRKIMLEKIVNSLGFVEMLLNPVNAPRMYFVYLKSVSSEDKKDLDKIYSVLSDIVLASSKLEIEYSEKGEAEMITKIVKDWNSIKTAFIRIIERMQKPVSTPTKEKSYFG